MVTIVEIARLVGVSKSTVSAVMRNPSGAPQASPETRRRILEAARSLGYSPNQAARSLREDSSRLIAVLDSCSFSSYVSDVIHGINDVLRRHHYHLVHCIYDSVAEFESQLLSLKTRRPDGWVVTGYILQQYRPAVKALIDARETVVQVCSSDVLAGASAVYVDQKEIGRIAAEYLLDNHHRRILYAAAGQGAECRAGFEEVFRRRGLAAMECCTFLPGDGGFEAGRQIFRNWVAAGRRESVVFAFDDNTAGGVLAEAYAEGVRIPRELSVLGVDDREFSRMLSPPLTTVHLPQYEQGVAAGELLLRHLEFPTQEPEIRKLLPELTQRASCSPPETAPPQ